MKLNVAIQMDHVSTIDIDGDSTFVLALEAERRGYTVWHYTPPDLIFRDRKVLARAQPMKLRREKGNHFTLGEVETVDLSTFDVVLLRQDPPFDMSYITTTHVLSTSSPERWWSTTRGVRARRRSCSSPFRQRHAAHPDHRRPARAPSATSTRTSSSSPCSATAARACSGSGPTT
jgi:hypothetical protein